jgi:hypothetical protein
MIVPNLGKCSLLNPLVVGCQVIADRGKTMALEWIAEVLRVSLFSANTVNLTDADWKQITGQDEAETKQKAVGLRTMAGSYFGGLLGVSAVGPRVDCILSRKPITEPVEEGCFPPSGLGRPFVMNS